MRRICTLGLSALCLMIFSATPASALVEMETCQSDADCQDGWTCQMECQDTESGEPDDAQCVGYCTPGGDDSSNNDCESDTDCPTGFECTEHSMGPPMTTGAEPAKAEPPCPEGEECGDSEEGAGDDPTDEMPPEESQPQEEIWKTCTPKSCETDTDCGGGLVCVLTTYECPGAVVEAPAIDCAEGEDCGAPPEEEPEVPVDDCEPETVGQCAPKWLAPCQEAADCGAGFECVEEEICWGTSSGGSMGGMPCDPDDEDCGEGFAPPPQEEKEGDDEEGPNEGCEPTGEFYCELQVIDCSSEACPEGLTCVEVPEDAITEDCAMSSDGEMDCAEPEEQLPAQVCVPEGYEAWIGGGAASSGVALDGSSANSEENAPGTGDDDEGTASAESGGTSSGGGSSDSGCSGSGSGVPAGTLVLSLLVLALIGRRRV